MDKRADLYFPVYEKIENEIIALSSSIHFVDEQADTYSLSTRHFCGKNANVLCG